MNNYSYFIANQVQSEWLANYYLNMGLEPYQGFCELKKGKYLLSLKGRIYKFNGRKIMAIMFSILNQNSKIDVSETLI